MKWFAAAVIYTAFLGLVGFAVYWTKSGACLWAILLCPSWKTESENEEISP